MKVNSLLLALLAASSNLDLGMAKNHRNLKSKVNKDRDNKSKKDSDDEGPPAPGPPFSPEIHYVLATTKALTPVIKEHETPIAARFTSYYDATTWNCVAAFSDSYMDTLTQLRPSKLFPWIQLRILPRTVLLV